MKLKSSVKGSDYLHNVIANYNYEKIFQGTLGGSNLEDVVRMIIDHYKNRAGINITEYEIFRTNSSSKSSVRLLFDKLGQKGVKLESLLSFLYTCDRRRDFEKLLTHFLEPESVSIIVHPPEKLIVAEDTELRLDCRANGFPFPCYKWLKDGKVVGEGETLRMRNIIQDGDSGEYTCAVSNHGPTLCNTAILSSTCHVDVQHNPCPRIIAIHQFPVSQGNDTMLKCEARGDLPLHFTWYKISPESNPKEMEVGDTLRLPLVNSPSPDRYRCIVKNGFGKGVSHDIAIQYQQAGASSIIHAPVDPPRLVTSKLALFIGITQYSGMQKTSGRQDAEKMMEVLSRYDFETVSLLNLNRDDLWKAIQCFADNVPKGSFVFVYVAAHGISLGRESYIIPPDVPSSALNADSCICIEDILKTIQQNVPGICVAVIDTCRVHRDRRNITDRECAGGAPNQLVFYSTLDGGEAKESLGGCSIFTKHFIPRMNEAANRSRILDIFQQVKTYISRDEEILKRDQEQTAEIRETLNDYDFHLYDVSQSRVATVDQKFSRLVSESSSNSIRFFDRINGTLMTKQLHSNVLLIDILIDGPSEKKLQVALYHERASERVTIPCISYTLPNTFGMLKWTFELDHLERVKEDALVLRVELTESSESSVPDFQTVKLSRPAIAEIMS